VLGQGASAQSVPDADVVVVLNADERDETVRRLAEALAAIYLYPSVGERYAEALRVALKANAYDGVHTRQDLADRLRADLQTVAPDAHLRLLPNDLIEDHSSPEIVSGTVLPEGIEAMDMMGSDRGVAYLRFTAFPHDPRTAPAARAFLLDNAGSTSAVIIDARALPGGGIEVMDAILPLFFDKRTVLVSMDTRAAAENESPFTEGATLIRRAGPAGFVTYDHVVMPDKQERRLRKVPLYYLISSETASAGEHLALALKRTGRGTLIGETTRGANHFGALVPVGSRLTAFVPVGRTYDPDTGCDWEGEGIEPDVALPAEAALEEALRLLNP